MRVSVDGRRSRASFTRDPFHSFHLQEESESVVEIIREMYRRARQEVHDLGGAVVAAEQPHNFFYVMNWLVTVLQVISFAFDPKIKFEVSANLCCIFSMYNSTIPLTRDSGIL